MVVVANETFLSTELLLSSLRELLLVLVVMGDLEVSCARMVVLRDTDLDNISKLMASPAFGLFFRYTFLSAIAVLISKTGRKEFV